jgi:diacylglycerol kinase family enzyme
MRALVVLNGGAGSAQKPGLAERVRKVLAQNGIEAELKGIAEMKASRVGAIDGADVIVAAGGDGTVSAVAAVAVARGVPLGVLPLGTLNHFARDVRIPVSLDEAARVIAGKNICSVDVGVANERVFVNNSSIGLYPELVRLREQRRRRFGKWPAMALSALSLARRLPRIRTRVTVEGKGIERHTPIVLVGNNRYESTSRPKLDGGELAVYVAHVETAFGMIRLAFRGLWGGLDHVRELELFCVSEVAVEARRHRLRVAVDGEITRVASPIEYRIRPLALRVFAPPP